MKNKMRSIYLYESVDQVELAFYQAFGLGDFVLMESLYASQGVSCTHPNSPTIIGRKNVIDNWEFVLEGIPQANINTEVLSISQTPCMEVRQVLESFDLDDFSGRRSEVYTTNVYVLQENGWRIQMQHSSLSKVKNISPELNYSEIMATAPQMNMVIN